MEGDRGKYTKDPVKVRFTTKADGRKSISFEIYQNGKRTYERLPDLFLLVETDDNSIRKNRATLNKVEKLRKQRTKELQKNPVPDKYISSKDTGQSHIFMDGPILYNPKEQRCKRTIENHKNQKIPFNIQ